MFYELRTYRCRYGEVQNFFTLYDEYGREAQWRTLGTPVFYAAAESGDTNSFVHIWAFRDMKDRTERRVRMKADPDWQVFIAKLAEANILLRQHSTFMTPAPFFQPEILPHLAE